MDKITVYSWPDGTWYYSDEIDEVSTSKSDDFLILTLPTSTPDDEVDVIVNLRNAKLVCSIINKIDDAGIFDIISVKKLNQLVMQFLEEDFDRTTLTDMIYHYIFPIIKEKK